MFVENFKESLASAVNAGVGCCPSPEDASMLRPHSQNDVKP